MQTCVVHLIRNSMRYASWKDRKAIAAGLRPVYTATTVEAAEQALEAFAASAVGSRGRRRLAQGLERVHPILGPACRDPARRLPTTGTAAKVSHLHSNRQRLTARVETGQ